jgi:TPR repeat protein
MKKSLSITFLLLMLLTSASYGAKVPKLDEQTQKQVVERVKEYCTLMQEFSGDVEKIENMDKIFDMCENSNVSVFNDLAASSTKDISDNSMPLQQYMMMLTDKFENNVKTSYSGFKYVKLIVQPSPMKEFDAASYAFVKVDKQLNATGLKVKKQHLNIIVNTATLKVSSTISEDYEDPQSVYMKGLEMFNEGKYKSAIPLFEKVSGLSRFSGRYRAKSMLGWIYAEQRKYVKANELLRESSDDDPLAGVILASKVLLNDDAPAKLINYTEAGQIMQKLSDARDKEIPTMHLIAKSTIVDAFDLQNLKFKIVNFSDKLAEDLISDPMSTDGFKMRGYFLKAFLSQINSTKAKLQAGIESIKKAEEHLAAANLEKSEYEHWDLQLSAIHATLALNLGDNVTGATIINEMKGKPYCAGYLAAATVTTGDYPGALELYRKAADYGDSFGAYVVSISCLPTNNPLKEYEQDFITETKKVKDEVVIQNWKKFVQYLFSAKSQKKSYEEFLKWNQKAIDLGDINAREDRAFFEAAGVPEIMERNIPHALELACTAASIGLRSKSSKLFNIHGLTKVYEMATLKIPFEETQTTKTLKALDEEGNGAASYLLFADYLDLVNDTAKAISYLVKSADAQFFYGMHTYSEMLMTNNYYAEAEKLFAKLAVYPYSYMNSNLGDIQKEHYHNYKMAHKFYMQGFKNDKDPRCCERLSDLYKDGLGVKKNLKLAKSYLTLAVTYYKDLGFKDDDDEIVSAKKRIAKLEKQIAAHEGNQAAAANMAAQLNNVLDSSVSEDERITLSQNALTEIFASPQAVVKTVGANMKTVVSTETAEDFMLRLATLNTTKRITITAFKKDKNSKLTELTVLMK